MIHLVAACQSLAGEEVEKKVRSGQQENLTASRFSSSSLMNSEGGSGNCDLQPNHEELRLCSIQRDSEPRGGSIVCVNCCSQNVKKRRTIYSSEDVGKYNTPSLL